MDTSEKISKTVWLILGFAFAVRFVGIWYGLPSLYNSDEPFNVINALAYGAKQSLEPTYTVYPALHSYVLFGVYGLYFIFGKLFGSIESALDFGASYFLNPTGLFMAGRFLSVLFGVAAIWLVYKIGRRFFSKSSGVLAAAFLTVSFVHTEVSHWVLLEPMVAFLSALALYFILKFYESPGLKLNLIAGIVCGLAISTKYNAGFIILPLILSGIFVYRNKLGDLCKHIGTSLTATVFGFLLGSPYWIFSFSSYWRDLTYSLSHVGAGMVGHLSAIPLVWPFGEMVLNDFGVGVIFIAGMMYVLFQKEKKQLLLVSFALITMLFVGLWSRTGIHYLIPIFPALAILGGVFLSNILTQKIRPVIKVALLAVLLLPGAIKIIYHDIRLTQTDTRTYARNWIESNIPEDHTIAYENYVYGPNLFDPQRFFKNSAESQLLPLALKERLLIEKRRRISYQLINLRKDFKLSILRAGSLKDSQNGDPYLRQLLETRLPKLSSVRKSGIKYLMISSDNYARYFISQPPKQGTPLWVSYQNGRRFYQSIFDSEKLILLREFKPGFWNMGPTIKVYQFKSQKDENSG